MPPSDWEMLARDCLVEVLAHGVRPEEVHLDSELTRDLGLSSLNKVLLLTNLCQETGVGLNNFTEQDLARMTTLRNILDALRARSGAAAS
ncbi:acyl carrier protein [Halostreptopolyspora alba]|uniref:Acyl carrier protein n=1 Tax=Halostreptopolyspora alba TaxID=2487137 RepID=A0A3N0EHZ2_9ACTN|nr:acyl carrier protein [Nocardiopsaceae bacterium YIM 96095]